MPRTAFFIELKSTKGNTKYGWYADPNAYPSTIRTILGVREVTNQTGKVEYGVTVSRPPSVRINFKNGGSQIKFCDPEKLSEVTIGGALRGKKIGTKEITTCSNIRG